MALERVCPKGHRWIQGDINIGPPYHGCPHCWAEKQNADHEQEIQERIAIAVEEAISKKVKPEGTWVYGTCDDCACWHFKEKGVSRDNPDEPMDFGNCQRNAPVCGGTSEHTYTAWPVTRFDNWCEEFRGRYRSVKIP